MFDLDGWAGLVLVAIAIGVAIGVAYGLDAIGLGLPVGGVGGLLSAVIFFWIVSMVLEAGERWNNGR